jgi:predicted AlkP superfamily phosphohydrolase/phosphomutase
MDTHTNSRRVVAIGLDAAERELVDEMLGNGELPALAALTARGARANLDAGDVMFAELTWTRVRTGQPPQRNGYWSNVTYDPDTYDCIDPGAPAVPSFWADLPGCVPVIFDVPQSSIDPEEPGLTVTSWGAHSPLYPRASKPQGLLTEIEQRFGQHPALFRGELPCWYDEDYLRAYTRDVCAGARLRADVFTWLLERRPDWTFAMTVFSEPHSIGHHAWHGVDPGHRARGASSAREAGQAVRDVYRAVDDAVGRIVARLGDDVTVMVFAAHGTQSNRADTPAQVLVPELLYRRHFGRPHYVVPDAQEWLESGAPLRVPTTTWGAEARTAFASGLVGGLRRTAERVLPDQVQQKIADVRARRRGDGPTRLAYGYVDVPPEASWPVSAPTNDLSYLVAKWYQPYWPHMPAFALPTLSDTEIRINLEGREARGVVPASDYRRACDELIAWLRELRDPRTGLRVVAEVHQPRRHDPHDPAVPAPDILLTFNAELEALRHPEAGLVGPVPMMRTSEHSNRAWAVVAGDGIDAEHHGADLDVLAIPRTLRTLLGARADGQVFARQAAVHAR